jgi:hypothetical protein
MRRRKERRPRGEREREGEKVEKGQAQKKRTKNKAWREEIRPVVKNGARLDIRYHSTVPACTHLTVVKKKRITKNTRPTPAGHPFFSCPPPSLFKKA